MRTPTPGPWRYDTRTVWAEIVTRPEDGPLLFRPGTRHPYRVADAVGKHNGPLIAAAPDLLAAVRAAERWFADDRVTHPSAHVEVLDADSTCGHCEAVHVLEQLRGVLALIDSTPGPTEREASDGH